MPKRENIYLLGHHDGKSVPEERHKGMRYPRVNVYLSNNTRCTITWRDASSGQIDEKDVSPALVADFRDLPNDGAWKIGAAVFDENQHKIIEQESSALCRNGRLRCLWALDDPIPAPWIVRMWAKQGSYLFEDTNALRIYLLSGRVTDFDGKPSKATVCANGVPGGCAAKTDEDGRYELWVPDRHIPELLAYDEEYGKTSLECWVYDYWPQDDLKLDMRIGQLELYELQAWRAYTGIKVDFLPMSVSLVTSWLKDRTGPLKYCPDLSLSDISVELDDKAAEIHSVDKRKELIPKELGATDPRDEYTLQVAAPLTAQETTAGSPQVLRVTVEHKYKDRNLIERGEAFYLGLRNER